MEYIGAKFAYMVLKVFREIEVFVMFVVVAFPDTNGN